MTPIFKSPTIIEKAWGKEIIIHNDQTYCGKILEFKKHHYSSLHYHIEKTETWYVLKGQLLLEYREEEDNINFKTLNPGDVIHLPPNTLHKITAVSDSQILEVSTPHKDQDTFRLYPSGSYDVGITVVK